MHLYTYTFPQCINMSTLWLVTERDMFRTIQITVETNSSRYGWCERWKRRFNKIWLSQYVFHVKCRCKVKRKKKSLLYHKCYHLRCSPYKIERDWTSIFCWWMYVTSGRLQTCGSQKISFICSTQTILKNIIVVFMIIIVHRDVCVVFYFIIILSLHLAVYIAFVPVYTLLYY